MPDYTNKKPSATKTTKRVSANRNFAVNSGGTRKKSSSARTSKSSGSVLSAVKIGATAAAAAGAVKAVKKAGGKSFATVLICFILALAIGAGVCFFVGKNDRFDIVGSEEISFALGETYADEGVYIKEFGLDLSKRAVIETDLLKNENGEYYAETAGDYYIRYTVKSLKFGFVYPVSKIRLVSVIGESEGGE